MRSNNLISYAFLSGAYANVLLQPSPAVLDPTITPAPRVPAELLRRQNDERFMGWLQYSSGADWSSEDCDVGGTLYQSGEIWRCCSTTANGCAGPVGCISGSLIYDFGTTGTGESTFACSKVYTDSTESYYSICNTGFLFENTEDSSPQSNVFCGVSANNWSYYRQKPADPTTSEASSSTSTTITPDNNTPLTTSPAAESTSTGTGTPAPKSESKAWIAGAVVGPIVGLALIGLGIFFCLRRRKNKTAATAMPTTAAAGMGGATPAGAPAPTYPGSPQGSDYYAPMSQNQGGGFVPYGVGVTEQKPQNNTYAYNAPHSPNTHGSGSPLPGSPQQQPQVYQHVEGPGSPQMLDSHLSNPVSYPQGKGASPPLSPGPPNAQPTERPFSSELDSNERVPQVHPVGK